MVKGRRPGKPDTKEEILTAARVEFARSGYEGATVRSIAAAASVDPSLVLHYFGSKEQLFAAGLDLPLNPATMVRAVFDEGGSEVGERLVATMLTVWDDEPGSQLLAALRSATAEGPVHDTVREFLHTSVLAAIGDALHGPDAELRAGLIASQIVGLIVGRYVLRFPVLVEASTPELAARIGPTIDRYASPHTAQDTSFPSHDATPLDTIG